MTDEERPTPEPPAEALDLAGQVRAPLVRGLPEGYRYGAVRYADVILESAFPRRLADLVYALGEFHPTLDELRAGGGSRTVFVRRFDESLKSRAEGGEQVWGKQNITIEKGLGIGDEAELVSRVRGHEIDMFGLGSIAEPLPGIAVEMEWNNKDPFFDRDLINFEALHHEGAIAVGVIVTRGPRLQALIGGLIRSKDGNLKFGQSSTHWDKLVPRVNLGGGGECPLLLIGIEPARILGVELAVEARRVLEQAAHLKGHWRGEYPRWIDAKQEFDRLRAMAADLLPPVADEVEAEQEPGEDE